MLLEVHKHASYIACTAKSHSFCVPRCRFLHFRFVLTLFPPTLVPGRGNGLLSRLDCSTRALRYFGVRPDALARAFEARELIDVHQILLP